ncbi:hypothetical protein BDZ97DRAFT_1810915 [Flammula alnicola]|nr:hypothetical protein BDZ97DRAFT_1810915 [Flammula alnicola]
MRKNGAFRCISIFAGVPTLWVGFRTLMYRRLAMHNAYVRRFYHRSNYTQLSLNIRTL